jgi:hypothetical protein
LVSEAKPGERPAVGLVREISTTATGEADPAKRAALESALATAESSAKIAEAEIAKAFGYELCKCEFPPTIMKTVGNIFNPGVKKVGPVYECPKCGFNTAAPLPSAGQRRLGRNRDHQCKGLELRLGFPHPPSPFNFGPAMRPCSIMQA